MSAWKKQWILQGKDWLFGYGIILGMGLIGSIIMFVILHTETEEPSYTAMGGIFAAFMLILYLVVMIFSQMYSSFNLAVSMGRTRKRFIISYYVTSLIGGLIGLLLILLFSYLEESMYLTLYPNIPMEFELITYLKSYGIPFLLLLITVLSFCGAGILKFGRKFFWVLWCIWMFCFLVLPRIISAAKEVPDSLFGIIGNKVSAFLTPISVSSWIGIGVICSILCVVGTYKILSKQQVVM